MDVLDKHDNFDVLLEQHRAVLEYECLVDSQQWSAIEEAFPDGPPECPCLICRQLEALSDRLVTFARYMHRYEKELQVCDPELNTTVTELIDIATSRRNPDLNAGDS